MLTYGTSNEADLRLDNVRLDGRTTIFDATLGSRTAGGARKLQGWAVPIPGHHNALNALAAIAVCAEAGVSDEAIRDSLTRFQGVKRRFQSTGSWNGIEVFDDYGHHPTEIEAVLKAARAGTKGRVVAVCEPHRYSRVRDLFAEFSQCFTDADAVIVTPLYSAGEQPIEGVSHQTLAEAIRKTGHGSVTTVANERELAPVIRKLSKAGDMVMCFGAGNSTEWAHSLPDWLAEGSGA